METLHDGAALAIDGGVPTKQRPDPPMFPGGMSIAEEEEAAVLEVLRSKKLYRYAAGGDEPPSKVLQLEEAFAAHKGTKHAIAVTSGTAALICALHGVGVGPGDEVIVPAYTWVATAAAVLTTGAVPIVAEVDDTLLLDPADFEQKITPYTKAVIPVHMRGTPAAMDEIKDVARRHNLAVIEDTAQANGASYKGKQCGAIGDAGCYSLQFSKIITSGEGGLLTTSDDQIYKRALMYHDVNGARDAGIPDEEILYSVNYRMPELMAAITLVQLGRIEGLLADIRTRKKMLKEGLAGVAQRKGIQFRRLTDPDGEAGISCVFFMDTPELAEQVVQAIRAENIGANVLYQPGRHDYHVYAHWIPVLEKRTWSANGNPYAWANREINYSKEMCPQSLDYLGRAVHLNVSPMLTNEDMEETIEGVNRVLEALA
ncbi:MAG: DegT/DnrJ/EryC1/StrS family aminotransferase [Chloroflexota bacterium]